MIARSNSKVSLDDVLAKLAALPAPPDAQQLRGWMSEYPEYRASIITFVTDWIEMEAAKVPHEVTTEETNRVVNRTMSRVQQILDEADRPQTIQDLSADIAAAGHTPESFQRTLGIDHSILACLAEHMVRPATIPMRIVRGTSETLHRGLDAVRDYFRQPLQLAAAHKARKRPESKQVDFAYLVAHADLPESEKAKWLAEPPDPLLQE
jgi:hypothetical protein